MILALHLRDPGLSRQPPTPLRLPINVMMDMCCKALQEGGVKQMAVGQRIFLPVNWLIVGIQVFQIMDLKLVLATNLVPKWLIGVTQVMNWVVPRCECVNLMVSGPVLYHPVLVSPLHKHLGDAARELCHYDETYFLSSCDLRRSWHPSKWSEDPTREKLWGNRYLFMQWRLQTGWRQSEDMSV